MSAPEEDTPYALGDYREFLAALVASGIPFTVIGGCAVGAYARMTGEEVFSKDLDLLVSKRTLPDLLQWARAHGANVRKLPVPRALGVAVFDWDDKPVDALIEAFGLPDPDTVADSARVFVLRSGDDLEIPIASPFHLLANKLAVHRANDLEHARILRAFLDEEIVVQFSKTQAVRDRIRPASRLMGVIDSDVLPERLARRLVPLASEPALRRFLVGRVPTPDLVQQVIEGAPDAERTDLESILATRSF